MPINRPTQTKNRLYFNGEVKNPTPDPPAPAGTRSGSPATGEGRNRNRGYFAPFRGKISSNLSFSPASRDGKGSVLLVPLTVRPRPWTSHPTRV
jgi:hypothetical protein